jgi:hypothetical protein
VKCWVGCETHQKAHVVVQFFFKFKIIIINLFLVLGSKIDGHDVCWVVFSFSKQVWVWGGGGGGKCLGYKT